MCPNLKKIISIFFTGIVLATTSSFTANMHFCCENLVSFSILGEARMCNSEQSQGKASGQCEMGEKDCCSNHSFSIHGQSDFSADFIDLDFRTITFLKVFFNTYLHRFEEHDTKVAPFSGYLSPLLQQDLLILHETLLI